MMAMRNVGAAVAMAGCLFASGTANAVTQPVSYDGGGFFTVATSSCATVGFTAPMGFTVVYRPAANGLTDGLFLQFQLGSVLLSATSTSLNGKQSFTSSGVTDKAVAYSASGTSNLKIVLNNTALTASITGTITNLYGDPSCTLTIRSIVPQRP